MMRVISAKFLGTLLAHCLFATFNVCLADVITFDDIDTGPFEGDFLVTISNGYHGLNWSNFGAVFALSHSPVSGYAAGLISPPNEAFNESGTPANFSSITPFTLTSGYFTGAWNEGLNITIRGLNGTAIVNSTTVVVSSSAPTLVNFNWTGLTEVTFDSFGGTPNPNYISFGSGTQFALDNLTLNMAVPEPATFTMLSIGIGLTGLSMMRRRVILPEPR
jgi:hypothetical protein